VLKKINATGNPGCTLFNSECSISAGNTLRIGTASDGKLFHNVAVAGKKLNRYASTRTVGT